jgi:type I restriction enzyme S subunit
VTVPVWRKANIGALCTTFSGGTPSTARPEYYGGDIAWIASTDLNRGRITAVSGRITNLGLKNSSARLVEPHTPLIALYGATAGVAAITEIQGAINQAVLAMVPRRIDAEYLFQWLKANRTAIIDKYTQGGQPNLSGAIVRRIELPLPTLAEQSQITEMLTDSDHQIAALERLIAKKDAVKQGMMQQLLSCETRLPGFVEAWKEYSMGSLGTTYAGLVGKTKDDFGVGQAQYVPFMAVMARRRVTERSLLRVHVGRAERQNVVSTGDLLFNTSSETPDELAMCAVAADLPADTYLNSFCFGFRLNIVDTADSLFLAYLFRSEVGRRLVKTLAQGAIRYNLSRSQFRKVIVVVPSVDEQRAIAGVLDSIDSDLDAIRARLTKAKAVKRGMMQELLAGRTRLPVKEEEEET